MNPATPSPRRPRLLLHTCCGPCATAVLERLLPQYDVTMLWYNPNLEPEDEYQRRREAAEQVAAYFRVEMIEIPPDREAWRKQVSLGPGWDKESEGGERCRLCWSMRVARTAEEAARQGFDYFDTTLTISPHKDADALRRILYAAGAAHPPVQPAGLDYRKRGGFQRSVELSRQLGLYRQNYCGCLVGRALQDKAARRRS
jgi:predicted adenine nucleotide alpha hydrolase (AANH) superfamily ATPase